MNALHGTPGVERSGMALQVHQPGAGSGSLIDTIVAAFFCSVLTVVFALADASVLFGTVHPQQLPVAIAMMLAGGSLLAIVTALSSGFRGCMAGSQGAIVVILATVVAGIDDVLAHQLVTDERIVMATTVVTLIVTTITFGVVCVLAGRFRMGRFIRYIPYPVVAGFLSGAALLLLQFAIGLVLASDLAAASLLSTISVDSVLKLSLALGVAITLSVASRPSASRYAVPLVLICVLAMFLGVVRMSATPFAHWIANDWTLTRSSAPGAWPPLMPGDLSLVNWPAVATQIPEIALLAVIGLTATLIKVSSLEVMLRTEVNQDRELVSTGFGNIAAAMAGGVGGYHSLSVMQLARRLNGSHRTAGVLVGLFCLLALFLAGTTTLYLPRFLFAGLILWVAIGMLRESLVGPLRALGPVESLIIVTMMVCVLVFGFMPAVVFGLLAGALLFIMDYGRINVVRQQYNGQELHSNVDRDVVARQLLDATGKQLLILRLHGYLFFGTAYRFLEQVRTELGMPGEKGINALLLDFEKISGIDTSANLMLSRLGHLVRTHDLDVLVSAAPASLRKVLENDDTLSTLRGSFFFFESMDRALEFNEDKRIGQQRVDVDLIGEVALDEWMGLHEDEEVVREMMRYMRTITLAPGETLFTQHSHTQSLYLVRGGSLDVLVDSGNAQAIRLRKVGPGAILGELSMYLDQATTAGVVATSPVTLLVLTRNSLDRMLSESPRLAALFHERMARVLAHRLADNGRLIRVLADA